MAEAGEGVEEEYGACSAAVVSAETAAAETVSVGASVETTVETKVEATEHVQEVAGALDAGDVVDVMQMITALRIKHHPAVDCRANHLSTVGLVVEGGCHISAVVPGGTAPSVRACPVPRHRYSSRALTTAHLRARAHTHSHTHRTHTHRAVRP